MSFSSAVPSQSAADGKHSLHWGLASILIGALSLIVMPMVLGTILGGMAGAYHDQYLVSGDLDLAVYGGWTVVMGVVGLALFALLCGIIGLIVGKSRRQPMGLPLAGTVLSLIAVAAAAVLFLSAQRCSDWVRWYQKERFERGNPYPAPVTRP
jgi:hypothetical protein